MIITPKVRARFQKFCAPPDANNCIMWLGCFLPVKGSEYGRFSIDGGPEYAHRVAYVMANGAIPKNRNHIIHSCDHVRCVQPLHLRAATHQANMKDRDKKGRQAKGNRQGNHILTERKVRNIRKLAKMGVRHATLAKRYGVHHTTIYQCIHGYSWNCVPK